MKILITGGAGFIGSNLCDFLLNKGHQLVIVDNLSTGYIKNISLILDKVDFYEESIERFNFDRISNVDSIIHLAAQPSVPLSISNFSDSSSSNLLGAINVIDYCRIKKIPLIYASSSAIYGNLLLGDDESSKVDLLSPYAVDKYSMELYAKTANKLYQLSSVGLRFFNVYGPRQDPNSPYSGVISIFSDRLIKRKPIIVNGGYQTRDFIYVEDVVKSIYVSLLNAKKNIICEQVNILTGNPISIDSLLSILMKQMNCYVNKIYHDLPDSDPKQSNGSSRKMVNFLNLNLTELTQLDKGLKQTISFIKGAEIEFK